MYGRCLECRQEEMDRHVAAFREARPRLAKDLVQYKVRQAVEYASQALLADSEAKACDGSDPMAVLLANVNGVFNKKAAQYTIRKAQRDANSYGQPEAVDAVLQDMGAAHLFPQAGGCSGPSAPGGA